MQFWGVHTGLRFLLLIDFSTAFNFFFQNVMTSPIFSSCQIRWGWQDECVGKVWFVSFKSYKHRSSGEKLSGWGDREYLSTEKNAKIHYMFSFRLLNGCLDSTLSIWDTGQDTQIWLIRDTKNILFLFEWWQIYCVTSSSPLAGFLPFLTPCFGFEAFKLSSRCLCCCSSSSAVLLLSFVTLMH